MGAAGKFRVLDFSALDDEPPVRVRSVENDDVSGLVLPFKASDHQPLELVPDLSAGTAGSAIPAAGSAPTPAARYRGGSVLPAEAPPPQPRGSKFVAGGYEVPIEDTALLMDALTSRRRSTCPRSRPRGAGRPRRRAVVRASSRGGDSGDPDLADSERPSSREAAAV